MAKAKIEGADFGFVKLIFDPKYGEILGAHIIGATATEMIAELSLGKVLRKLRLMKLDTRSILTQRFLRLSWKLLTGHMEKQFTCNH